ncbi:type I-A CRISPR-associated protein Cas4/Csa1 [Rubrobacter xylanophilus]|uniref:Type I-A CRISPR-associated protein Cas4/Csa1 n=2 Tax=Rubrobacter xylanophilus TaxID=49319 RepID=A0A510HIV4_9ACTN|nr:type I-A CRISPR-associated protein Cas4/Csa1 [Rubrobacter xylanophilus]
MFMPTAEERKRLLRGVIPRARRLGVDDTLRGWSWSAPPLLSPYEVPLGLSEVAGAYCETGRDVYARRVLGIEAEPNEKMLLGGALHGTLRDWVVHAKRSLYACGVGRIEEAVERIRTFPAPELPEAKTLVQYETDAIEFRIREAMSQFPRIGTDALVAQVLPVTLGQMLDGAFLGLSRRLSTDLLNLGEPVVLDIIFDDEKRDFHPLTLAGYALVLEAVYEFPVDVGLTVYANFRDGRLRMEREFTILGDEVRMEFIEARDEKQRMVADAMDPGSCEGCEAWCGR